MKKLILTLMIIALSLCVIVPVSGQHAKGDRYTTDQPAVRFAPVDIFLDSGRNKLAAYQFEFKAIKGNIKIVGIEGGQHKAFKEAPYYDPAAMMNERVIIAAFNTSDDLPTGKTRVATIHLQITGDIEPEYEGIIEAVADTDGNKIPVTITIEKGEQK